MTEPSFAMHGRKARIEYLEKRNHELECAMTEIMIICERMIKLKQKKVHRGYADGKNIFEKNK
ncbi:MAG: hypothetical protein A2W25_04370 [candidate division Zixibacteria bacterium RBG_16_53_22]|nr:MAG: hypothetical protein A2W25_04370 [candidate division Zixibacteria bacterium RBG_16_53_22]